MKNIYFTILLWFCALISFGQGQTITLTFLGQDAGTQVYLPLESVYVQNTTLGCDTTLFGDNPTLVMVNSLGINDPENQETGSFTISQPVPNPFRDLTTVQVMLKQSHDLKLSLVNTKGVVLSEFENEFAPGVHHFEIMSSSNDVLFLVVSDGRNSKSVKLVCLGNGAGMTQINYSGFSKKNLKTEYADGTFKFQTGNQLLYKSVKNGYYDAEITDSPAQDITYTFQLTPVAVIPTVITYEAIATGPFSGTCGGEVVSDGGADVTARGLCWSTLPNPTISDYYSYDGTGTGVFYGMMGGLTPETPYYVRAYATNTVGTGYGEEVSFVTGTTDTLRAKLTGTESKTWKLIRVTSTNRYPIQVFAYNPYDPDNPTTSWWAMGLNNDELALRPCMLNDQWTFYPDGTMVFESNGDYWAEGGVFDPANFCANTSDPMIAITGEDLSAWAGGTHQFELVDGPDPKLKAVGSGAYIGFYKLANDYEVMDVTPMIQGSVEYDLIKLTDSNTDTLIIQGHYYDYPGSGSYLGTWRFVLVHYDDPADEPPIPGPKPNAGFTYISEGTTVYFTNTTQYGSTYYWDFGDGASSTEVNPVHTYAGDGSYFVTLTAYNINGEHSFSAPIIISSGILTEEILTAGPWKLQVSAHSCYVGPAMGSDGWWICPLANLDGSNIGTTDDWSCMTDDEFIFSMGGGYEYKTNGGSRNDGYMGAPNGCWSDAEIAASPGAPFGSCNTHSFVFEPVTGTSRAIITLTNGPGYAAFIGFMKGYYGGENTNGANPPNGGFSTNRYEVMAYVNEGNREILIVTVDISYDHSASAAWTMELERLR